MIRRYTCVAVLMLLSAAMSPSPTLAQDTHTITIDFEDEDNDGCIDPKSITVDRQTKKVKRVHGGYSHKDWFDGDQAAADVPEVTWKLAKQIHHYDWTVEIKDRSKRQYFGGVPLPIGTHKPKNDGKKVDKYYIGSPWKYKVTATYNNPMDPNRCESKVLDPQVKFKRGPSFLETLFVSLVILTVLTVGGLWLARRGRATP